MTSIELVIDDVNFKNALNPESKEEIMPLLIPNKCSKITLRNVRIVGVKSKAYKSLLKMNHHLQVLRLDNLILDDVPKFMKMLLHEDSKIETLVLEFEEK